MTTSERASALVQEMPRKERPISEEFRIVAKAWVEADAAARLLEETRSSVFSKIVLTMQAKGRSEVPPGAKAMEQIKASSNAQAEHMARASDDYQEHITKMVQARDLATLRKVQMEFVRMQFTEWQMGAAAARDERKMSR